MAVLSEMYVQEGVLDASGEPTGGGSVRSRVFAGDDLGHGVEAGRVPEGVCGTSAGGGVSVCVAGCPVSEKVREEGSVRSRAVQIALGIDGEGRRQVLAAEVANRESEGSWTAFLSHLKERGLRGVEYVVSDRHEGLKHAISKVLPTALWQRCCVHFLRNARDKLSRSADPACLEGLRNGCGAVSMSGRLVEALGAWVARWGDEKGFGRLVE